MDPIEEQTLTALAHRLSRTWLPPDVTPRVRWGTARRQMGSAHFGLLMRRGPRLTFSRPLMAATTPEDRVETVHHEVAHLIVFYEIERHWREAGLQHQAASLSYLLRAEGSHGRRWHEVMRGFGYHKPLVKHDVKLPRTPRGDDVQLHCRCAEPSTMALAKAARGRWMCRRCKSSLATQGADALAVAIVRASEHPERSVLPAGVVQRAQTMRGWPGAVILRIARELADGIPYGLQVSLGMISDQKLAANMKVARTKT